MKRRVDFSVRNEGSLFTFEPLSKAAKKWVSDNVNLEDWQWMGPAFAVDHRFAAGLAEAASAAGFILR